MEEDSKPTPLSLNVSFASSLLDVELDQAKMVTAAGGSRWKTGSITLDKELPSDLWTGGSVIGVGSLDAVETGVNLNPSLELITTHLIEQSTNPAAFMNELAQSVFIIAPPNQATTTIQQLFTLLSTRVSQSTPTAAKTKTQPQSRSNQTTPPDPKRLLEGISLLQYLDAPGLLESLSEVSSTLSPSHSTSSPTRVQRTVLLVQGLPQTVTSLHRRSGLTQSAALTASALHTLRSIARSSSGSCLVLVELEFAWRVVNPSPSHSLSHSQPSSIAAFHNHAFSTAFTSRTTTTPPRALTLLPNTLHPALAQLIERNADVIVALHDADGRVNDASHDVQRGERAGVCVVEVVRDERMACVHRLYQLQYQFQAPQLQKHQGGALGRWCVWRGRGG